MPKPLTVSIVIPVYNEAALLGACLDAVARQTEPPHQVIVVDNNSTDQTASLAQSYDFVTLVSENRQGTMYARTAGFCAATGDIIGRIDADTVLAPDWTMCVRTAFAKHPQLDALTGGITYHSVSFPWLFNALDTFYREAGIFLLGAETGLQGANMAIRRTAWLAVRDQTCVRTDYHEDLDLAIHLHEAGRSKMYAPQVRAAIVFRQACGTWRQHTQYTWAIVATYLRHGRKRAWCLAPGAFVLVMGYPLLAVLTKGYDAQRQAFRWQSLLRRNNRLYTSPLRPMHK